MNRSEEYFKDIDPTNPEHLRLIERTLAMKQAREYALQGPNTNKKLMPRMDCYEDLDSDRATARLEIPGIAGEHVDIQIHLNGLKITGKREVPPPPGLNVEYKVQELKYGMFERYISIPEHTQKDELTAELSNGILTITWPMKRRLAPITSSQVIS